MVTRYRIFLENRQLAAGTINGRLAAGRRLVYEAADAGFRDFARSHQCGTGSVPLQFFWTACLVSTLGLLDL